jgi:hypothetical protein
MPNILLVWVVGAIVGCLIDTFCCAVAYRISRGYRGLDIGLGELLWRSAVGALGLTVLGCAVCSPIWLFGRELEEYLLLGGIVNWLIGAQILNWSYGLDDWLAGSGIFFLRIVPGIIVIAAVYLFSVLVW